MKTAFNAFLALLIGALVGGVGFVLAYPGLAMSGAAKRLARSGAEVNEFVHPPRVTEDSRGVVRPAPDLVYSVCVYDLTLGPVRISTPPVETGAYVSLAFYASTSDNFAVINDQNREFATRGLDIVLTHDNAQHAPIAGAPLLIESPTRKGVVLMRRALTSEADFDAIDAERRKATCGLVPP